MGFLNLAETFATSFNDLPAAEKCFPASTAFFPEETFEAKGTKRVASNNIPPMLSSSLEPSEKLAKAISNFCDEPSKF
ncbi:MAG: hypothetical protein ACD_9C00106G0002 [uncultured bacterium]|nr:MAG: hypothetical protein ACD_9C00106G0002 [uncultured bacterium]